MQQGLRAGMLWLLVSTAGYTQPLEFEGRVEAARRAEVSSFVDGIVAEIHFAGGEAVTEGAPLFTLDGAELSLAEKTATAARDAASARLTAAEREQGRIDTLRQRQLSTESEQELSAAALAVTRAELAAAAAELERARLDLRRTIIRAPMRGIMSRPAVALGAYVEAEAGAPLAEIVQLDPVLVAYEVPYSDRLRSLENTGASTLEALFERIRLQFQLPGGRDYGQSATPDFASATVDRETGAITVWAQVANPDRLLRPGMSVRVLSDLSGESANTEAHR